MASNQVGYVGAGPLFIGLRAGGPLRYVGQVPEFKLNITDTVKEMKDYAKGAGVAERFSFIDKVEATIVFSSSDVDNLALALGGVDTALSVTPVTTNAQTAYPGALVELVGVSPKSVTVTVVPALGWVTLTATTLGQILKPTTGTHFYKCTTAGTTGATEPTWKTDGTETSDGATLKWADMGSMVLTAGEYEIVSAGIVIPIDSVKIASAGTPVNIAHTPSVGYNIQALVNLSTEYRVIFAGKNMARAGKGLKVTMYRVIFATTKELALITEDFTKLTLTASILSDDTKTGTDISAFCQIEMEAV